ncbi:MAG: trypsin-like serine protease [Verrucomicrobia bacterium]|nr:trypsin-like serine protease [Verrucomicrobiota bacterium]
MHPQPHPFSRTGRTAAASRIVGRPLSCALLLLSLIGVPAVRALDVFGYSATTNERFGSGFPSSPVANPSFFLGSYDLSGIGWGAGNFGVTLISPQHFVTAAHVDPGSSVSFLSSTGVLRTYTVDSTFTIEHASGVPTDLLVGRLTSPIAAGDNVTYYSTVLLSSVSAYNGLTVAAFGQGQRAGTNTIDTTGVTDLLPFGSPNGTFDNVVFVTDFDSVSGQTQGQAGDSGSPSFVSVNGSLALVGTHSAVNTSVSPNQTVDVLVPYYYSQINARLALDGYTFGAFAAIPEPSELAALTGAGALGVATYLRRRRRTSTTDRPAP